MEAVGRRASSREHHLDIEAHTPTQTLSLAQRQMLEVVQALLSQPKVLLLDEPTTALGHADVGSACTDLIRDARRPAASASSTSATACPRCSQVANRITVLRDGVSQGTFDAADLVRGRRRRR